jgi:hypothetical protein
MSGLAGRTSAPYLEHLSHAGLAEVQRSVGQTYHPKLVVTVFRFEAYFRRT